MMHRYPILLMILALGCAEADLKTTAEGDDAAVALDGGSGGSDASADGAMRDAGVVVPPADGGPLDAGEPPPPDTGPVDAMPPPPPPVDAGPPPVPDAAPPPPPPGLDCEYRSPSFDAELTEYDVMGASNERLGFDVPNLPDPSLVDAAHLVFVGYDLDHPGEEGRIWINGNGPFPIPTDGGGDNVESAGRVDVFGTTEGGTNRVEFGSSLTEPRTYFRIGRVALVLRARVPECVAPPPPPPREAVVRSVHYRQARYTQRENWVVRCNDYAFTARGDEHLGDDCDRAYRPDGSRRGTAIFDFPGLVPATYEVVIRSRHTANRNPRGALFIVDGEERRVSQVSDRDRTDDVWGQKRMGGDITVTLDSSREGESDSIISVTLRPVGP
jgi:hypothetical protein